MSKHMLLSKVIVVSLMCHLVNVSQYESASEATRANESTRHNEQTEHTKHFIDKLQKLYTVMKDTDNL